MVNSGNKSQEKRNNDFSLRIDLHSNEHKKKPKQQRKPKQQKKLKGNNSKSQVQKRKKWQEEMRKRRERTRADPAAHAAAKEKDRQRWYKRKAEGKVTSVSEMSDKQKCLVRERNREYARRYRDRKKEALLTKAEPHKSFPLQAYPIRLLPNEEVTGELLKYVGGNGINGAFILTCVGSVRSVHLRYATGPDGKEKDELIEENMEICSLGGTCSTQGLHLHGTFGKADGSTISGHVLGKMIVQTTAEIVLGNCEGAFFCRLFDAKTGFKELAIAGQSVPEKSCK